MARTRAERRVKNRQVKDRMRTVLRTRLFIDEPSQTLVGHWAATHGRPCSCIGCKRGRRPDRAAPLLAEDLTQRAEIEMKEGWDHV